VGTEVNSANLANAHQQAGIGGLGGLYSTELGGGENALGLSNQALSGADKSSVDSSNNPWLGLLRNTIQTGVGMAAGGG
jgi:hypothetical protein